MPGSEREKQDAYQSLSSFFGRVLEADAEPMLEILRVLRNVDSAGLVHLSLSHTALGLSLFPTFVERTEHRMVYLAWQPRTAQFLMHYQAGQGKTTTTKTFALTFIEGLVPHLVAWLEAEKL